ncbi:VSR endonuclease [Staphylococcus phage ZCSS1]|uniref:VSR endonuclease n=1 Tax=Staphylococcus phage UHP46 TaxID=3234966 RepID=A0AB39C856_9CAUD|nr:VSR endonuclease [Staphylococcus phage ZCSS1]
MTSTNQFTFNIEKSKEIWKDWCINQNLKPLVEYEKSQQTFYFEFLEGKFKGLVGKTYWASIKRGSIMLMSCLTPESKDKYIKSLGESKGIKILEDYKGGRKIKHKFIVAEGKYQGCEGYITLNDLESLGRIDNRSLSEKGRKQYFDKQARLRDCVILEYPKDYRIKTKDKIIVKDKEGHVHNIIVQDFFEKTSLMELSCASEGEKLVKEILTKNAIKFEKEKSFRNKEGRIQRFDFYINENNKEYVIEYNGAQHYRDSTGYLKDTLEVTQKRDKLKKEYIKDKGIELLIIPYTVTDKKEMEEMILNFLNK